MLSCIGYSQETLSALLKTYNKESVPYISVQELAMPKTKAILLDAREIEEYEVSHIKGAIFVGYSTFNLEDVALSFPNLNTNIVVYCSLGVRSETIAEQLKKRGYTNVYNLFGGIFEWKNNNFPVYNSEEKETEHIHAYSKAWSKWLIKGKKIYE
ncbi:rhodanese-like domain-containing protein [Winogradskyella arenosi]|uniref:Rhodanese-related sulfurtransferase n=1 Tax=Winogradskyella arenosi TaxID=533325 RepID=A0A368ZBY3_9FLAO|nr:rhodanese-like domain-containing protein [Winogradskyella arenosi]RCW90373.1 rhodanese-related sulfurtransferase [Winogradskyella arenosi]